MRQRVRVTALAAVVALLLAGCSSSDDGATDGTTPLGSTTSVEAPSPDDSTEVADSSPPTGDLDDCPAGFDGPPIEAGSHQDFTSEGQDRAFHLLLPEDEPADPAPLFVSLTGTVQEEVSFMEQSGLDQLPADGWIVVAPVRNENGLIWGPWDAMRTPDMAQPNPDVSFILDLVACLSAHHTVDQDRIFVGGISIGGTLVNYLLQRHSDVFAGGIVGSGNFILTTPPDLEPLEDTTVIVAWGGDDDQWTGCPDGRMGAEFADEPGCVTADFVADAAAASQFYADQDRVRLLACEEDVGHIWITSATGYWAAILAASPKGTSAPIDAEPPPGDLVCSTTPPG